MHGWPEKDELDHVSAALTSLDDFSLRMLWNYSSDLVTSTRPGAAFGPGLSAGSPKLVRSGLVEKIPGWKLYSLSEKGMRAARLFTAEGTAPTWIEPLLPLRKRVREEWSKPIDNRDDDR